MNNRDISFTVNSMPGIDLGIECLLGVTSEQAEGSQPVVLNVGSEPLTITLAPGTGIYVRPSDRTWTTR